MIVCPLRSCTCDISKIVQINIDWLSLGVDTLLYTAMGFNSSILLSTRTIGCSPARVFKAFGGRVSGQRRISGMFIVGLRLDMHGY
jgi:hypothetical protein